MASRRDIYSMEEIAAPLWQAPGRVRLRTLVLLRWLAIGGQTAAVLFVQFVMEFELPLMAALLAISASAALNIVLMAVMPLQRLVREWEAACQLAYDLLQLAALIALTGGLQNPFTLLFIAPVAVSATVLRPAVTAGLAALAFVCVGAMTVWHAPLPWATGASFELPQVYQAGLATAVLTGLAFTGVYAWRVAAEEERLTLALAEVQAVLAREQRMSALGAMAAALAHELGTPLATIHLVAKEMSRELPAESPLAEDVQLLVAQSERCRAILRQLADRPGETSDALHERLQLSALLEEAAAPHHGLGQALNIRIEANDSSPAPELRRMPEIIHGLSNLIENAVGFATAAVEVEARWSASDVVIVVRDDGPGFPPDILPRLGEPFLSERGGIDPAGGLGLGFFIAKTLLERSGAKVAVRNEAAPKEGAVVRTSWPRAIIEAPPL